MNVIALRSEYEFFRKPSMELDLSDEDKAILNRVLGPFRIIPEIEFASIKPVEKDFHRKQMQEFLFSKDNFIFIQNESRLDLENAKKHLIEKGREWISNSDKGHEEKLTSDTELLWGIIPGGE